MSDDDTRRQPDTSSRRRPEKRQRTVVVTHRLTPAERTHLVARADRAGLTVGAYLRALATDGTPGPRARRRPPADHAALRKYLGEMGRVGNNLNQIARYLHTGGQTQTVLPDLEEALRTITDMRGAVLAALGKEADDDN